MLSAMTGTPVLRCCALLVLCQVALTKGFTSVTSRRSSPPSLLAASGGGGGGGGGGFYGGGDSSRTDQSGWGSNQNDHMGGSTFSAPLPLVPSPVGGLEAAPSPAGALTTVATPLKAMVFVDGTWLYYSVHERGNLCPIRKEFGANWQERYEVNWAMLPRIIARSIEDEMRSALLVDRHVEVSRTVVFTSAKASTPPTSRRIQVSKSVLPSVAPSLPTKQCTTLAPAD